MMLLLLVLLLCFLLEYGVPMRGVDLSKPMNEQAWKSLMLADPTIQFAVIRITQLDGTIDPVAIDSIFYAYQVLLLLLILSLL